MLAQATNLSHRRATDHAAKNFYALREPVASVRASVRIRRDQDVFEIRNVSGRAARGIEIELAGFSEDDVFQAYYLNRHGAPRVSRTSGSVRVCFESLCRMPTQTLSHSTRVRARASTRASQPFVWELALFGGGGNDRFCLELSTLDVVATYRWLIASDESAEPLVAYEVPAHVYDARAA